MPYKTRWCRYRATKLPPSHVTNHAIPLLYSHVQTRVELSVFRRILCQNHVYVCMLYLDIVSIEVDEFRRVEQFDSAWSKEAISLQTFRILCTEDKDDNV